MASAKAMARIDWTRIFVEAPGLRPTASEAFMPMKPTPRAAPRAARPTWMLPAISASMGLMVIRFAFRFCYCSTVPAIEHGQTGEIVCVITTHGLGPLLLVMRVRERGWLRRAD